MAYDIYYLVYKGDKNDLILNSVVIKPSKHGDI